MLFTKGDRKKCPYCKELIKRKAIKCKHCGSMLNKKESSESTQDSPVQHMDFEELQSDEEMTCEYCKQPAVKAYDFLGKVACERCIERFKNK